MNKRQRKTLKIIFADPLNGNLEWRHIESLLMAVGCPRIEGSDFAVSFEKDGIKVRFHRPHPQREALRYRLADARLFLQTLGVTP